MLAHLFEWHQCDLQELEDVIDVLLVAFPYLYLQLDCLADPLELLLLGIDVFHIDLSSYEVIISCPAKSLHHFVIV